MKNCSSCYTLFLYFLRGAIQDPSAISTRFTPMLTLAYLIRYHWIRMTLKGHSPSTIIISAQQFVRTLRLSVKLVRKRPATRRTERKVDFDFKIFRLWFDYGFHTLGEEWLQVWEDATLAIHTNCNSFCKTTKISVPIITTHNELR